MEKLEIWKEVPGYNELYMVSSFGNVKSLDRVIPHWKGGYQTRKGKLLKLYLCKRGYNHVDLAENGINKTFKVSVLVAMCFLNHIPDGSMKTIVFHKDGFKNNDKIGNLILRSYNINKVKFKYELLTIIDFILNQESLKDNDPFDFSNNILNYTKDLKNRIKKLEI